MNVRNIGAFTGMVAGLIWVTGCTNLENRVAALETITATHATQLDGIVAKEAYTSGKPLSRAFTSLTTLPLPAGSYVLATQISGSATKQYPTGVGCQLNVKASDGTVYQVGGGQAGLQAQAWEISPIGTVTLTNEGIAELICRAEVDIGDAYTSFSRIVAVGLPRVESTALKEGPSAPSSQQSK